MSVATFTAEEKTAILATLARIEQRLNEAFAPKAFTPGVNGSAKATVSFIGMEARQQAKAQGWFTVAMFAAAIGRHTQWVSDRCRVGVIRTLPGGKPYRIPLSEEERFNA